jgi:hypothetical protein
MRMVEDMTNIQGLVPVAEVLDEYLHICRTTFNAEVKAGRVAVVKIGRRVFMTLEAIQTYLDLLAVEAESRRKSAEVLAHSTASVSRSSNEETHLTLTHRDR